MSTVISILICTRNRASSLKLTLGSLAGVRIPDGMTAEVIVVDNASDTAEAAAVIPRSTARCRFLYVPEPRAGKGYAYNRAIREAGGDVLLFTDDDVRPSPDWITGMSTPLLAGTNAAVIGGVRLAPHLERQWLRGHLLQMVACTESRSEKMVPREMIGANMAISRRVFAAIPGFDVELGPGALGFCDESLVSMQIRQAGFTIAERCDVLVEHHFDESRLDRASFLSIATRMGRSQAYLDYHWRHRAVSQPHLRRAWISAKHRLRRLLHTRIGRLPDEPTAWECAYQSTTDYLRFFASQRGLPRKYELRGLSKRG